MPIHRRTYVLSEVVEILKLSEKGSGHGLTRHLHIGTLGLMMRTFGDDFSDKGELQGVKAQNLTEASAFAKDDFRGMAEIVMKVLNSSEGQNALDVLDTYQNMGVSRVAVHLPASTIGCNHQMVRVYYRDQGLKLEALQNVTLVVDSNPSGQHPIAICTAFPSKGIEGLGSEYRKILYTKLKQDLPARVAVFDSSSLESEAVAYLKKCTPMLHKPANRFNLNNKREAEIKRNLRDGDYLTVGQAFIKGQAADQIRWFRAAKEIDPKKSSINAYYFVMHAQDDKNFKTAAKGDNVRIRKYRPGEKRYLTPKERSGKKS